MLLLLCCCFVDLAMLLLVGWLVGWLLWVCYETTCLIVVIDVVHSLFFVILYIHSVVLVLVFCC